MSNEEKMVGVRSIKEVVDRGMTHVPSSYIVPLCERPVPSLSAPPLDHIFPVLDLQDGLSPHHFSQIREWGFSKIVNHAIPISVMEEMHTSVQSFFEKPTIERMQYYSENDISKSVSYVTSFNKAKENVHYWKDTLRFQFNSQASIDDLPITLREATLNYCVRMKKFGSDLYAALSKSLGVNHDYLETKIGAKMTLSMHYYPTCPSPDLTLGFCSHSDPNMITIILQDQVGGLQILKDGQWFPINPIPGAFLIMIGDQIQILTNGRFKSVRHRVVTNSKVPRISIVAFFNPLDATRVAPLANFIDEEHPPLYKEILYKDYVKYFYEKALAKRSGLDFATIQSNVNCIDMY